MRRLFVLVGCTVLLAAVGAACTSFRGAETPPPDASASDAPSEAETPDAPPVEKPPFCATNPGTFCVDFDDPGAVPFGSARSISDGGAAFTDDAGAHSPPAAMHMTLSRSATEACGDVVLRRENLGGAASEVAAEMRVKLLAASPSGLAFGVKLRMERPAPKAKCDVYLGISSGRAAIIFELATTSAQVPLTRTPVAGEWSHVELELRGAAGARTIGVRIDGLDATEASPPVPIPAECQEMTTLLGVDLGIFCAKGEIDLLFDDVRVTAR